MEREGREEEKRRGRRGGVEKMKMRGIVIGGMVIGLLMGCNNGGEERLAAEKRLGEIGRSAESVFYSFVDFIADTLGFRVTEKTKKNQVGEYFTALGTKIGEASAKLEEVAVKAEGEGDKDVSSKNPIRVAVEAAKTTLSTLKTHLDALGTVGGDKVVGWAENNKEGAKPSENELKKAYNALKGILKAAKDEGVPEPKIGGATLKLTKGADNKEGAKILSTSGSHKPTVGDAGKAASIVSTASGEEILAAIVSSGEDDPALSSSNATVTTTAMSFVRGNSGDYLGKDDTPKAAAVAGGIALRSLVKDGKLASHNDNSESSVQGAGISAVNKLLGAVEDIVKKTVKKVLEKAKGEIDKARASKEIVQK